MQQPFSFDLMKNLILYQNLKICITISQCQLDDIIVVGLLTNYTGWSRVHVKKCLGKDT